ncbi:MBL fold metallo-hydrolase [Anoxybacillus ayderensis]|uniref:MBL fold metallo-hydrolase n=1 Tax=Anoxybacillus sp. ST70 TaxID=2864180 RepID=UPI0003127404|nr:MBL fold metallo-hydrolase [Anoxybacillus sp. ST70]AXM89928.1 MBL fold metallo-hydrolase [Anoxybacillus ayderensis G10]MBW9218020.1 MBL fold metallo-hydrolase [Anoxybacillus sp. ST70]THD16973.1 MBL fold metallo-hydrolase [Anoxybacillus ayderensis]
MEQLHRIVVPTPFAVGDVNMYIVKGDRLTLIDAGVKTEEAWHVFVRELRELGYEPEDIEQVIITHHHPDHVGLLDYLPPSLPVIGHRKAAPWIAKDAAFFAWHQQYFEQFLIECGIGEEGLAKLGNFRRSLRFSCERSLTQEVKEGDMIEGWTVIETPGHAQSHIVLYREADGLMIGGDHLLATISSNPLLEPPAIGKQERPKPLLQYNDSLKKLLNYDIATIVTGHGEDVTDVASLVEKRLEKQKERAQYVWQLLSEKPMTAFDVCRALFPSVYEREFLLTMSETIGQLDYLEAIGAVKKEKDDQIYMYEAVRS